MTATNLWTDQAAGPASYTTGGFVITTTLSTLASFAAVPSSGTGAAATRFSVTLNSPGAGQATVKAIVDTYQKASVGAVSGLPSGVTAPAVSGSSVAVETAHSHAIDHDHAVSAASATATGGSGLETQAVTGGVATSTHTHTVDLPNLTGTSGTQTHQHTWDNIYQHQHSVSSATTTTTLVEFAAGTDFSGIVFNYVGADA